MAEIFKKAVWQNLPFWILTITAIALLIISIFIPPAGVIDGSVIAGIGELLGFGALWTVVIAIEKGIDAKLKHNDTEITLGDLNKDRDRNFNR